MVHLIFDNYWLLIINKKKKIFKYIHLNFIINVENLKKHDLFLMVFVNDGELSIINVNEAQMLNLINLNLIFQ